MDDERLGSEQSAGRALGDVLRPLFRRMNSERSISLGKMGILSRVSTDGAATSSSLAAAIRVSPQAITIAVRELEALGFVTRTPDAADRRRIWIDITGDGRACLAQERGAGSGWLDEVMRETLTDDERATLAAALPVLRKLGSASSAGDATSDRTRDVVAAL